MRNLILCALLLVVGCDKNTIASVTAPSLNEESLTPIARIPVIETEIDDPGIRESFATDTLNVTTEINGQYFPEGTVVRYENWRNDAQNAKYLILVVLDYACHLMGPPPPGHDYEAECNDPTAWVAPQKPGIEFAESNRHWVVTDPNCLFRADGDGSVIKTDSIRK